MHISNNYAINKIYYKPAMNKTGFNASSRTEIKDGYVKIPLDKYYRDKVLEYILCGILGAELIYKIIELWGKGGKPPFP